jgi:DinB superfamily
MNDVAAVIAALEQAPGLVVPLVREVPPAVLKRRPAPKKWSAHEHACHLAVVHDLFFRRLEEILMSPAPVITPYDPGQSDPDDLLLAIDLEDALQKYEQDRARLVARLRDLSDADWRRTADHGEYSHYSVFIMFRHVAFHDFLHAYRIEELLLRKEWAADWQAFTAHSARAEGAAVDGRNANGLLRST